MKRISVLITITTTLLAASALLAQHNPGPTAPTDATVALPKPVQAVFDSYIRIQTLLAQDSMKDVSANATAIENSVRADTTNALPGDVALKAGTLAKAGDIKAARKAFKVLSDSLINYLEANKAYRGHYVRVYCRTADARWLQVGTVVSNPYFGEWMAHCGKIES